MKKEVKIEVTMLFLVITIIKIVIMAHRNSLVRMKGGN